MRAIRIHEFGGIDTIRLNELPHPVPRALNLPIGEVLKLADASTAHRMLDGAPHKPGKIVLRVAD